MASVIEVNHLEKRYGSFVAVEDVSFSVEEGEIFGILGPNGAGKTTTMRVITGYLSADSGTVTVDGIPVDSNEEDTRRLIGYLPEDTPLYPDLEVLEFLRYVAALRGLSKPDTKSCIEEMVTTCGLKKVVGRPIGQLSRGFRQRVGLAQAMVHQPPILILDEPTSGLDPNQIIEIRNLIKDIGKKRTVVLSTHILQEVEATCSRALIIANGSLVGHGTLDELSRSARGEAIYTTVIRAPKETVEGALEQLEGIDIRDIFEEDGCLRVILQGDAASDRSEDIFKWVVDNKWSLCELKRETASLEEVFKELTT